MRPGTHRGIGLDWAIRVGVLPSVLLVLVSIAAAADVHFAAYERGCVLCHFNELTPISTALVFSPPMDASVRGQVLVVPVDLQKDAVHIGTVCRAPPASAS
jgi:hypothetical protein